MQISGAGHWFLEGWISDHSVEFLVDSGSSVTAMSNSFYQTLIYQIPSTHGSASGHTAIHCENATQRERNWHRSVGMLSLRGVIHGITDGISHHNLQPHDRN